MTKVLNDTTHPFHGEFWHFVGQNCLSGRAVVWKQNGKQECEIALLDLQCMVKTQSNFEIKRWPESTKSVLRTNIQPRFLEDHLSRNLKYVNS